MNAIKINICGASFLLPDSHQFYEFPTYIVKHKKEIQLYIERAKQWTENPLVVNFEGLPDLTEFKRITGIIGFPLDSHDAQLYALDRKIEIGLEVDL